MEQLLNNAEAALVLGISPYSMRSKVYRREVPFIKIGRRVLFSPSALQKYIEDNTFNPRKYRED